MKPRTHAHTIINHRYYDDESMNQSLQQHLGKMFDIKHKYPHIIEKKKRKHLWIDDDDESSWRNKTWTNTHHEGENGIFDRTRDDIKQNWGEGGNNKTEATIIIIIIVIIITMNG